MSIIRIATGDDGRSYFEDIDLNPEGGEPPWRTEPVGSTDVFVRTTKPEPSPPFHHPTSKMLVITLDGEAEVRCGDGTARRFGSGDVLWADDVEGEGHQTIELTPSRTSLIVRLDPSTSIESWQSGRGQ
jgi:hypothetical protein